MQARHRVGRDFCIDRTASLESVSTRCAFVATSTSLTVALCVRCLAHLGGLEFVVVGRPLRPRMEVSGGVPVGPLLEPRELAADCQNSVLPSASGTAWIGVGARPWPYS